MVQIFLNLLERLRQFLLWIWKQEGTPAQRARGMALGVFSGCFPFFGFQTLLGVMLASLFRGNRLLAATGTWISNPFTYLPLYWLNYKIGSSLLSNNPATLDVNICFAYGAFSGTSNQCEYPIIFGCIFVLLKIQLAI